MVKCKLCNEELFERENCFGDTKDMSYICCSCFEELSKDRRKGIVQEIRNKTEIGKAYTKMQLRFFNGENQKLEEESWQ